MLDESTDRFCVHVLCFFMQFTASKMILLRDMPRKVLNTIITGDHEFICKIAYYSESVELIGTFENLRRNWLF